MEISLFQVQTEVFISSLQSHLLSISFNSMYLLKDTPSLLISLCLMCWSMLYSDFQYNHHAILHGLIPQQTKMYLQNKDYSLPDL